MKDRKYLIYKISGGLNHMLIQINRAIHLSKLTNRVLFIDTNDQAFKHNFSDFFHIENFEYYTDLTILDKFEIEGLNDHIRYHSPTNYYLVEGKILESEFSKLVKLEDDFVFVTWINCTEDIEWNIKLNEDIKGKLKDNLFSGKYLGVHFRNTDMKHDISVIFDKIKAKPEYDNIYLATDDFYAYDKFKLEFPNKHIIQYTIPYKLEKGNPGNKNIHYSNPDKDEVIYNALLDMYMLIHATEFIPSPKSSFSRNVEKNRVTDFIF